MLPADIKWLRLKDALFDPDKIRQISAMPNCNELLIIWLRLLAQAGRKSESGWILLTETLPYTINGLAMSFEYSADTIRQALNMYRKMGMIEPVVKKMDEYPEKTSPQSSVMDKDKQANSTTGLFREADKSPTQTSSQMTLAEFGKEYEQRFGRLLPGGARNDIGDLLHIHTRDKIIEVMVGASESNAKQPVAHILAALKERTPAATAREKVNRLVNQKEIKASIDIYDEETCLRSANCSWLPQEERDRFRGIYNNLVRARGCNVN